MSDFSFALGTNLSRVDGSRGLVVMGRDSCSEGRGFEPQHHILDGHFFTCIFCKNCNDVSLKRPKINDKRGLGWPNFLKNHTYLQKDGMRLSTAQRIS